MLKLPTFDQVSAPHRIMRGCCKDITPGRSSGSMTHPSTSKTIETGSSCTLNLHRTNHQGQMNIYNLKHSIKNQTSTE